MVMAIPSDLLAKVFEPNEQEYFTTGPWMDRGTIEAKATLITVKPKGCKVHIDEIIQKGESSTIMEGDTIFANWGELEVIIYQK
jgi:hypothetical protein